MKKLIFSYARKPCGLEGGKKKLQKEKFFFDKKRKEGQILMDTKYKRKKKKELRILSADIIWKVWKTDFLHSFLVDSSRGWRWPE